MNLKKIKRAIISVHNKSNLKIILPILKKYNVEIISSGGSFKKIKDLNYNCIEVSNYTGFSEILDGRVKTLHPKIYAGILSMRNNKKHLQDIKKLNIPEIDLVIVDLYPFEAKLDEKTNVKKLIEYIDIGGASMIRAAAKNFNDVVIISNIGDYSRLDQELKKNRGSTSFYFRKLMSAKAFSVTAYYDSIISNWMNEELNIKFPEKKTMHGKLIEKLRYGENPHQQGGLYSNEPNLSLKKISGKALSYNNYNDIYSGLAIANLFNKNEGSVIIKHANPSGVSIEKNQLAAFENSYKCDPISAFGGVVIINSIISKKLAIELNKKFFEVIVAKDFNKDALRILKKKKNIRLIVSKSFTLKNKNHFLSLDNSFLMQDTNDKLFEKSKVRVVTRKKPSAKIMNSLKFAFNVCRFVRSNAIVLANEKSTIGIGSGQPSRLDSCKIASSKASEFLPDKLFGSVAASDAFFPFADGLDKLINCGVDAIIQPGGSINDKEVIKAANKAGITMIFTGTRHFKH